MPAQQSPNHLLASLDRADFDLVAPFLRPIELPRGVELAHAGETLSRVYFPYSGVISMVVSLTEGETVEVAMVGRDSVFGAFAALDGQISLTDAIVQLQGAGCTLEPAHLRKAAEESSAFRAKLMRHEQALFAQAQQSAACNISHTLEARLSRWLLRMRDLSGSDSLPLTQEFLAQMLGVRRSSVTIVANALQRAGLIRYSRGAIEIVDLDALRETSCECYETVRATYRRLLNDD